MTESAPHTRGQTPEERLLLTPTPRFAPGDPVPGLSSWVLERKLGGGGFGEVWLARHSFDTERRPRAVKFCTHPSVRHRLIAHERNVVVRAMKYAGKHPNILPLLEHNLDGDIPWLMYEFVAGGTLADLLARWSALPAPKRFGRAVRVLHALAGALAACHRLDPSLVHRDLKPQNVLMDGSVPRITDFGIGSVSLSPQAETDAPTALSARIPTALRGTGTRLYAPPEQMLGAPPNPRDDVYALGVIAYQLLIGDLQTGPGTDAARELRARHVPARLTALVVRSVALNPTRRPKDLGEWETVLGEMLADAEPKPVAPAARSEPEVAPHGFRDEAPTLFLRPTRERPEQDAPEGLFAWFEVVREAGGALANHILTAGYLLYFLLASRGAATDPSRTPGAARAT